MKKHLRVNLLGCKEIGTAFFLKCPLEFLQGPEMRLNTNPTYLNEEGRREMQRRMRKANAKVPWRNMPRNGPWLAACDIRYHFGDNDDMMQLSRLCRVEQSDNTFDLQRQKTVHT